MSPSNSGGWSVPPSVKRSLHSSLSVVCSISRPDSQACGRCGVSSHCTRHLPPIPGSRREGWRAGFDDGVKPLGHSAIRFLHLGNLREHVVFPVSLARARAAACGRLQLFCALPHRGSFLIRKSLRLLSARVRVPRGLLRAILVGSHRVFLPMGNLPATYWRLCMRECWAAGVEIGMRPLPVPIAATRADTRCHGSSVLPKGQFCIFGG